MAIFLPEAEVNESKEVEINHINVMVSCLFQLHVIRELDQCDQGAKNNTKRTDIKDLKVKYRRKSGRF